MPVDWASIGVMLVVGGLLWRQIHALSGTVGELDRRLTAAVAELDRRVANVDRRLARLEGWSEGERVGRGAVGREAAAVAARSGEVGRGGA